VSESGPSLHCDQIWFPPCLLLCDPETKLNADSFFVIKGTEGEHEPRGFILAYTRKQQAADSGAVMYLQNYMQFLKRAAVIQDTKQFSLFPTAAHNCDMMK
jgi:hypothetical protein